MDIFIPAEETFLPDGVVLTEEEPAEVFHNEEPGDWRRRPPEERIIPHTPDGRPDQKKPPILPPSMWPKKVPRMPRIPILPETPEIGEARDVIRSIIYIIFN